MKDWLVKDRQMRCRRHKLSGGSGLEDWLVKDRQVRCRRRKLSEGSGLEDWLVKDRWDVGGASFLKDQVWRIGW